MIIFLVEYLSCNSENWYISKHNLKLAIEDYIEVNELGDDEAEGLRKLAERDSRRFISSGDLSERFKPYVLPFLKEIGEFLNRK